MKKGKHGRTPDFDERLARYGLRREVITAERLVVTRSSRIQLDGLRPERSSYKPRVLETKDLAEFKHWVGVDDELFRRNPHLVGARRPQRPPYRKVERQHPKIRQVASRRSRAPDEAAERSRTMLAAGDLHAAAMAYVYGPSWLVEEYRKPVELEYVRLIGAIWTFDEVVIEVEGTLALGQGSNVLAADRIELHPGASIQSMGPLKLDCVSLKQL